MLIYIQDLQQCKYFVNFLFILQLSAFKMNGVLWQFHKFSDWVQILLSTLKTCVGEAPYF